MTNDVFLLATAGVPVVLLFLFRINGAVAFLSLCAGSVLLAMAEADVSILASAFSRSYLADPITRIIILLLPLILCIVLLRHSISASKSLLNLMPAAATGVLVVLLVVPLLPGGVQYNMMQTQGWHLVDNLRDLIMLGGVVLSILFLSITKPKSHHSKKH